MLETSLQYSVSHLNHIILSWDDENPLACLNPEWWKVFENRLDQLFYNSKPTSVSKGQFLAWLFNLTVIFYGFSREMYKLWEAMKKKSILIMACKPLLFSIGKEYFKKSLYAHCYVYRENTKYS